VNRPSLKARDIEALVYTYRANAAPLAESQGQRGSSRRFSAMVLVTAGLLLLAVVMLFLLPV